MFVPVILDFENNGLKFMLLKYLRFLDLSIKNQWCIITHEDFEKYEINFPGRNEYKEMMQNFYGYSLHSVEERSAVHQYFVPHSFFENLEANKGSKLESAIYLLNERDMDLEAILENYISDIITQYGKIDGLLYFAACPLSVKIIAEKYEIPMVAYETGPIRMPNYRCTTSYFCRNGLYDTKEITNRYEDFKKMASEIPLFKREEILAMFLTQDNLDYLSLIDKDPKYEIGIAGGCALVVPYFALDKYMDHELIDDVLDKYHPKDILVRLHPGDMYKATYRLPIYDATKTPFAFLLDSKRIAAVGSNLLFEAMLWKRIPCSKTNVMPSSIMCFKDYTSVYEKDDVEEFVNFFVFCFLVPSDLAYDEKYILWRLSKPSEKEVFIYHLSYYMKLFGLTDEWLGLGAGRCKILLAYRNYNPLSEEELRKSMVIAYTDSNASAKTDLKATTKNEIIDCNNQSLQNEVEILRFKCDMTQKYLDNVLNSTSWKLTAPIRRVLDAIKSTKIGR